MFRNASLFLLCRPLAVRAPLRRFRDSGFALVIALVLMGFMMLLLLSLGSLVQVDLASSTSELTRARAERNAMLGLKTAIGQLQRFAGPDLRTTTRGDYRDGTAENAYWVAVWDNERLTNLDPAAAADSLPKPMTYLVSGNETNALRYDQDETFSGEGTDSVLEIVRFSADARVRVKKVEISDDGGTGSYAYWISDEGMKANVGLMRLAAVPAGTTNFSLLVPQTYGVDLLSDVRNPSGGDSWFDPSRAGSLVNNGSLSIMRGGDARQYIHDVTFNSKGVLTNSKSGGLKKDLTAGLAAGATELVGSGSTDLPRLFPPQDGNTSTDKDPGGPLWKQLQSWANTPLSVSGGTSYLPVRSATNEQAGFYPVVSEFQMYFVPRYDPVSGLVWIYVMPAVVLWNPYDTPLESANYKIRSGRALRGDTNATRFYLSDLNAVDKDIFISLQKDYVAGEVVPPRARFEEINPVADFRLARRITNPVPTDSANKETSFEFVMRNVTLQPGETKVFTPLQNEDFATSNRELGEGMRYFGYRTPLEDGMGVQRSLYTHTETDIGDTPDDTPQVLNKFITRISGLSRTAGFQLSREGSSMYDPDAEVLTEALYLNLTFDSNRPAKDIRTLPGSGDPIDIADGVGWKVLLRNSTPVPSAIFGGNPHQTPYVNEKWLPGGNPRAATFGTHRLNFAVARDVYDRSTTFNPSYVSLFESDAVNFYIDPTDSVTNGRGRVNGTILFEAPRGLENLFTVGQLTHAPLYYWADDEDAKTYRRIAGRLENTSFDNLVPANPIGNSFASPLIDPGETFKDMATFPTPAGLDGTYFGFDGVLYDYSYLLNDALWDEYFFSSLTAEGGQYLPRNPRLVAASHGEDFQAPSLTGSAANMLVDGAFNVNSTSVEAWKALLASFYGRRPGSDAIDPENGTPILRVASSTGSGASEPAPGSVATHNGYRTLTDTQIGDLAEAIVKQVRERGPFPTLSAFVNRSLHSSDENHRLMGALAAAIAETSLNGTLRSSTYEAGRNSGYSDPGYPAGDALDGHTTEGLPGWLTPADILSRLGSVIGTRSDTFLVRAYGEYGTGADTARAWCEAVVQRMPRYVDSGTAAEALPAADSENARHGRRFEIISFRWLSEDEI